MNYKSDQQKEFCSLIQEISRKYSIWQVWNDFLQLSAIALANAFPNERYQEREERFQLVRKKYTEDEYQAFSHLLALVTLAFERNPRQDFLGEVYQLLNLNQHQKGQFFTPYHICEFMGEVQMVDTKELLNNKDYITVSDPACGAGALLIACSNVALKNQVNYQKKILYIAQDIDQTAALMCYIQLSLLGCCACVIHGYSLVKPGFHPDNEVWVTVMAQLNWWRFRDFFHPSKESEEEIIQPDFIMPPIRIDQKSGQVMLDLFT